MIKKVTIYTLLATLLFAVSSCGIAGRQQIQALKESNYNIQSVDQLMIVGMPMNSLMSGENVSAKALPAIGMALLQKNVPIQGRVNLKISNDTETSTHINQFKYKVEIGNRELFEGTVDENIIIDANKEVVVPMSFRANLFEVSEKNSFENILSDVFGDKNDFPITLKIKPSFRIGNSTFFYPGYISVNKVLSKASLLK